MALSSGTKGFYFRRSLTGLEHPAMMDVLLDDSATYTIGDMVRFDTDGHLVVAGAGESVIGVLRGLVDRNGIPVSSPRASGTDGATVTNDDTVATSSTNTSDDSRNLKGQVVMDPGRSNLYYNDADDDLAQTNVGQCFDLTAAGDQVDVGTATDGSAQVQLIMLDPDGDGDASKGLFRIVEVQY